MNHGPFRHARLAGGTGEGHQLDFRVGGREVASGAPDGGPVMTFKALAGVLIAARTTGHEEEHHD